MFLPPFSIFLQSLLCESSPIPRLLASFQTVPSPPKHLSFFALLWPVSCCVFAFLRLSTTEPLTPESQRRTSVVFVCLQREGRMGPQGCSSFLLRSSSCFPLRFVSKHRALCQRPRTTRRRLTHIVSVEETRPETVETPEEWRRTLFFKNRRGREAATTRVEQRQGTSGQERGKEVDETSARAFFRSSWAVKKAALRPVPSVSVSSSSCFLSSSRSLPLVAQSLSLSGCQNQLRFLSVPCAAFRLSCDSSSRYLHSFVSSSSTSPSHRQPTSSSPRTSPSPASSPSPSPASSPSLSPSSALSPSAPTSCRFAFPFHGKQVNVCVTCVDEDKVVGPQSASSLVKDFSGFEPDVVLLPLGYLDYSKILQKHSKEALLKQGKMDDVDEALVASVSCGAYVPLIQRMLLLETPHFCVGRSKLSDISALAERLFWLPVELYKLLGSVLLGKTVMIKVQRSRPTGVPKDAEHAREEREKELAPTFYKTFYEDSPRFMALKTHHYLHMWTRSPFARPEPKQEWKDRDWWTFILFGRSRAEKKLRTDAKELEQKLLAEFPASLSNKATWNILVVSTDSAYSQVVKYFKQIPQWKNQTPFFADMHELEDTYTAAYYSVIVVYIFGPALLLLEQAYKGTRKLYRYVKDRKSEKVIFFTQPSFKCKHAGTSARSTLLSISPNKQPVRRNRSYREQNFCWRR
ncbi:putative transmembrane protein [Toxoplasma gondii VAND]|uniref:Putative transmembrane protein n=1 Tax=Toxoplasma gondii VAND TaxID=933077 RepID=A0A086Q8Z8_TOXGO|nr:putative transmembrane protein [Toxoplasma gondii VAND]